MSNTIRVRLTTIKAGEQLGVRATTKIDNKSLFANGADEKSAIANLRTVVDNYQKRQEFKAQYPKTVEVKL